MSTTSVPLIDISPFLTSTPVNLEARRACAKEIFTACTSTGFFYLTKHGIPTSLMDTILAQGKDFFLNSTTKEKAAIIRKPVGMQDGDGARGWQPVRDNVTGGKRDWQEAVDFYRNGEEILGNGARREPPYDILMGKNYWPLHPVDLKNTYEEYIEKMLKLGEVVVTAMGTALGEGLEEEFVKHTRKSFWSMRLIGYAPIPEPEAVEHGNEEDGISCGEHTDYGCVTLLLTDSTKGALKVRSRAADNAWIDVDPIHGAFVVNIGDMMERWTNGLWRSTAHKVVHRGDGFRVSLPFFYEPDFSARRVELLTHHLSGLTTLQDKTPRDMHCSYWWNCEVWRNNIWRASPSKSHEELLHRHWRYYSICCS
jgi:isopenicillin N synthase-like dioxygenase